MLSVMRMVPWLLIAITVASVVFQDIAVLLLATALVGLILWTVAVFKHYEKLLMTHALGMVAYGLAGASLSRKMQQVTQHLGLPEPEGGSEELESMLKKLRESVGGPTPPDMTA